MNPDLTRGLILFLVSSIYAGMLIQSGQIAEYVIGNMYRISWYDYTNKISLFMVVISYAISMIFIIKGLPKDSSQPPEESEEKEEKQQDAVLLFLIGGKHETGFKGRSRRRRYREGRGTVFFQRAMNRMAALVGTRAVQSGCPQRAAVIFGRQLWWASRCSGIKNLQTVNRMGWV